ncbi:hypothetical protein NP493_565g02005 [Ridgeia piscesae]|uniref:Major facilitator superfamily associated domain-containing protein n=1 Tax=Ridgeia piscesae TaxID=27915 RepID=A0AAD9NPI7_RIDPI|nr:hypothetical protein NP493_565g02005 [Ridgeia piscesae]
MPFIHGITRTFIGGLADKLNAHKSLLMILCLLTGVFHGCMVFVPRRPTLETFRGTGDVRLHCGTHRPRVVACNGLKLSADEDSEMEFEAPENFNINDCMLTCNIGEQQQKQIMSLRRSNQTACNILNKTATVTFNLSQLQPIARDKCRDMTIHTSKSHKCRCYTLESVDVGDLICKGMICEKPIKLKCNMNCSHHGAFVLQNNTSEQSSTDRKGIHLGWIFWSIAILYFVGQLTSQPIFGMSDALTYNFLGEKRNKWGRQRLWGTIGWAVFAPISGLLMDHYNIGGNHYSTAFLLFAVFMVLTTVFASQYKISEHEAKCSPEVLKAIISLIRKPEAFVLLTLVMIFGVYGGFISSFLFWHLKLMGDVPQVLFGLCLLSSCSLEVVVMFFSGRVFRSIGHANSFSIVCVVFAIRLASYSFVRNPWMVLLIEPLHAITFGLMYAAASTYASRITPPGAHGSVQNIISSLHFCFGRSFGTLLGGRLFEIYGGAATFRMFAASSLVLLVLHVIAQKFWIKAGQVPEVTELEVKNERQDMSDDVIKKNTDDVG